MYILGIFACTQSGYHAKEDVEKGGDHSLEDLAKFGYKINIKYESNTLIQQVCLFVSLSVTGLYPTDS